MDFFFIKEIRNSSSNTGERMILPKDEGLAFPRKLKEKKTPSPLRSKPKKYQKATISEEHLQNHAEETCIKLGLDYDHTPQELYHWLASPSDVCPIEAKSYLKRFFIGRPDLVMEKNLEGTDYILTYKVELKTDSPQSKLRSTQRHYNKGKNHDVLRFKEEIKESIKHFSEFEI
tara:strand:- start:12921 stop:13442 length:522 start_codon:yes stop_codon:yes gene_type:complete